MIVVDACVAVKWLVPEPLSQEAEWVLSSDRIRVAPEHVIVEIGQALLRHVRSNGIAVEYGREALARAKDFLHLMPTSILAPTALQVAVESQCTMYDALYVAMARWKDCRLITADAKLKKQLKGSDDEARLLMLDASDLKRELDAQT